MHLKSTLCGAALSLVLSAAQAEPGTVSSEPLIAIQALRADVDLAYSALKEGSPGLYRFTSKREMDGAFATARARIDRPMTSLEFYRILAPAMAAVRNGHTTFSASDQSWAALRREKLLPLGVRVIDGRVFVLRDFSGGTSPLAGSEILSINGRPAQTILSQLSRSSLLDGSVPGGRDFSNSGWGLIYNLSLVADVHSPYRITVRRSGATDQVTLAGSTSEELAEMWKRFPNDREARPDRKPTLRFAGQVSVLTIPHWDFVEEGKRSLIDDIRDWFAEIKSRSAKSLVIDIRSNSGGDETVATALFAHLVSAPFNQYRCIGINATDFRFLRHVANANEHRKNLRDYTRPAAARCRWLAPLEMINRPNIGMQQPATPNYSGNVIVLVDGGSFSTSAEFAAMIRNHRRGTIVGQETSGSYYGSDSGIMIPLTLPASKAEIEVPTIAYRLNVRPDVPKDRGVTTDVPVQESISDMIAGRDRVMEEAMRLAVAKPPAGLH